MPNFGISQDDLRLLSNDCSIVFNSAASIRFIEPIDVAVCNNIFSVGQLVGLCNKLSHLEAIVHLSTAYSNCHKRDTIHEIFYESPLDGHEIQETVSKLKMIQDQPSGWRNRPHGSVNDDRLQSPWTDSSCKLQQFHFDSSSSIGIAGSKPSGADDEPNLLKEFTNIALRRSNRPNTYTLTKAISERYLLDKVRERPDRYLGDKIPVAIVRPSVVGAAWREPNVGLIDNCNGATGAILSLYTGALQAMPGVGQRVADVVPVDMVTNMVLSAGWFLVGQNRAKTETRIQQDQGVYLFNFVSGHKNPLHWQTVTDNIARLAYKYPSKSISRLPSSYFIPAGRMYDLYDLLNQKLPAYLVDLVRGKLLGQRLSHKSSSMAAYSRIRQMTDTLAPFTSNQWKFSATNVQLLFDSLSPIDKSVFHFDVGSIDWPRYIQSYIIGARINILGDRPEDVAQGLAFIRRRELSRSVALTLLVALIIYYFCAVP